MLAMIEPKNGSFDTEANLLAARFLLSPLEARLLRILLARDDASKEDIPISFAMRQLIYTLRRKLERIGGVYIVNDGGGRYSIPRVSKRILRNELRGQL